LPVFSIFTLRGSSHNNSQRHHQILILSHGPASGSHGSIALGLAGSDLFRAVEVQFGQCILIAVKNGPVS
jgi:hypothetical protein